MSEEDRSNSFISCLINHTVLPKCGVIVTSHPIASLCLHHMVDLRVEVLGFTKENRLDYIEHALEGSNDRIKALQSYLQSDSIIDALCYIPLSITTLLSLFVEVSCDTTTKDVIQMLPNTQIELYRNFILTTIIRFLKKYNIQLCGIDFNIFELPEPHCKIPKELSQLAFFALQEDTIVFNIRDIAPSCPNLTINPDNWNGLGAAQFVSKVYFHFLHFSIQEYLAACHIALLSRKK